MTILCLRPLQLLILIMCGYSVLIVSSEDAKTTRKPRTRKNVTINVIPGDYCALCPTLDRLCRSFKEIPYHEGARILCRLEQIPHIDCILNLKTGRLVWYPNLCDKDNPVSTMDSMYPYLLMYIGGCVFTACMVAVGVALYNLYKERQFRKLRQDDLQFCTEKGLSMFAKPIDYSNFFSTPDNDDDDFDDEFDDDNEDFMKR